MQRYVVALVAVMVLVVSAQDNRVFAQAGAGPGGMQAPGAASSNMPSTPEQSDQQRFFRENVYGKQKAASKATAAQKVTAMQEVSAVLASSSFACKPSDAAQVAAGPATVNGKEVDTKTYEIACDSGVGYFLVAQPPEKPEGFTCFAADHARAADVAQKRPPSTVCSLPANLDMKAMAGAALAHLGKTCAVRDIRWIGQNSKAAIEFLETACTDGTGYVVKLPQPQSAAMVASAVSCADAVRQGIACKLTKSVAPMLTIQTFKDELAKHNVACDAANVRVIGKQTVSKRHVVEFQCPQQPKGLVALIPLDDSAAPFQTMDCAAAAKQRIDCKLMATP